MENEYPSVSITAAVWVLAGWTFLDLRLIDHARSFKGSYALVSILLSAVILFWLKRKSGTLPKLLPNRKIFRQIQVPTALAFLLAPLGFATGFISLNFSWPKLFFSPLFFAGIYLTVGLVEELVFRRIILVYLEQRSGLVTAVLASSLIFGLFHLNNGGFPNWLYVFLATAAGLIYGLAFKKGGLAGAVTVHAFVDTFWLVFFKPI